MFHPGKMFALHQNLLFFTSDSLSYTQHLVTNSHLPRAHQLPENVSHLITQSSPLLCNPFFPLNHSNKLNNTNFPSHSILPTIVYDHISRLSCLHALGMQPNYTIYSAVLSYHHRSFLPPPQIVLPSDHNFTDYEAALYLSHYESLPPHYENVDSNENRKLTTIPNIIQIYNLTQDIAQLPTPIPISRRFTDIEAALYMSITGLLPPNYELTNSSHQAPTITPLYNSTDRNPTCSLPTLIPQSHFSFMLPFITSTSLPDPSQSAAPTPEPTPYINPESLPPLPIITTPSIIEYPDPLTLHKAARTLAMRCLRETSSIDLNPDVLSEMDQALTNTIDQLQQETTDIETILPQIRIFITNLQNYHGNCTSRLAETRHTINHLQAVRAVIMTFTPRPSVIQSTPTTLNPIPTPTTRSTPTLPIIVPPVQPPFPVTAISTSITSPPHLTASTSISSPSIVPPPITLATTEGTSHPTPAQATSTTNAPVSTTQYITPTHQH